ncbi:hypothetical protein M5689_006773 [Euphorbia peplus]|nr:hypothetical protein M5689_006773 [Euphorbia peplus]
MDFYSNLISNGTYDNHESYLSQEPELSQVPNTQDQHIVETDFRASRSNNTKKTGRSKNFSVQEDLLLISAWLNIGHDNITGNNQPLEAYWERVPAYFNEYKNFSSECNSNSLMHRCGITEQDKVCQALEMYKTLSNPPKDFAFLHCWNVLRYAPKFINLPSNRKAKHTQNASLGIASYYRAPKASILNKREIN